jgi:hypothetical protein
MLKVSKQYHFLFERGPVKVYSLQGMPFTWDDLTEIEKNDPEVLTELAKNNVITLEDILNNSAYLIAEEMHPLIYDIALTLDSELPDGVELE